MMCAVAEMRSKNLRNPDEKVEFPLITGELLELGDLTVGYIVSQPGWRWSEHVRPIVGGQWCQARHVGVILSGRLGVLLSDGTTVELGPEDVFDVPPGHDGWTIGDEPCVQLEWAGLRTWAAFPVGAQRRALVTILMTDIVDSTAAAKRLGDIAWRELLSSHYEGLRVALDRFSGREIQTTGDGMLATFDAPANALRCAATIRRLAGREAVQVRAAVHVGEVELVGGDIRGVAVHEAARIMASAAADEILVSETTRVLALAAGLEFEERGTHELKGLAGTWQLYAYSERDAHTS